MNRIFLCLAVLFFLICASNLNAQSDCPVLVQAALAATDSACHTLSRNHACYGHIQLVATPRENAANFVFEQSGDIADMNAIEALQLSAMNEADGTWGVALMKLQANLPDTLPGQNVTFLVFGDVQMHNDASAFSKIRMRTTDKANVRARPSTDASVLRSLDTNISINATGRLSDNSWIRIQLPGVERAGWVSGALLSTNEDVNTLTIVEAGAQAHNPFQAFTFTSGVGDSACAEAPSSGILVQTPKGVGKIAFTANGVRIQLGSTAYLQAQPDANMTVTVIEGQAALTAAGTTQIVPQGTFSTIPLDANGQASGAPSYPESYDPDALSALPLEIGLPLTVEVSDPPDVSEIPQVIDDSQAILAGQPDAFTRGANVNSGVPDCDAEALLPEVKLYAAPSRDSAVIMTLYQGAQITVSGFTAMGWIRGGPVDGVVGNPLTWIPAEEVQLVGLCQNPPMLNP